MNHILEVEHIATRSPIRASTHLTRAAAEAAAVAELLQLGEPVDEALDAARAAGWTGADAVAYVVRIYEQDPADG